MFHNIGELYPRIVTKCLEYKATSLTLEFKFCLYPKGFRTDGQEHGGTASAQGLSLHCALLCMCGAVMTNLAAFKQTAS